MTQPSESTAVQDPLPALVAAGLPLPLVLDFSAIEMTDEQLVQFCADNGELRIELTADRELIVMPPAFPISGMKNNAISAQIYIWSKQSGTGISFDSSTGFTFPNGAMRSPDASWIARERWDSLEEDELSKFTHIAPDFVVELRSHTDSPAILHAKMAEYIENGVKLGWLIDPFQRQVHVYRPGQAVEILDDPKTVSGDPVLPGFTLNLLEIW